MGKKWLVIGIISLIVIVILVVLYINFSNFREQSPCDFKYEFNGKSYIGTYCNETSYFNGLNWLKENTPVNSTIMTAWDESSLVRAFANRNTIVYLPSKEYAEKYTGYGRSGKAYLYGGFSDSEKFKEVELAYTTSDIEQTKDIMKKYETDYIFLTNNDYAWGSAMSEFTEIQIPDCQINDSRGYKLEVPEIGKDDCFSIANASYYKYQYCKTVDGINNCYNSSYNYDYCLDYFEKWPAGTGGVVCLNENSTMYKMLKLNDIDGFEKVYSDNHTAIYKLN